MNSIPRRISQRNRSSRPNTSFCRQGHGDHGALPQAAGKLMGKLFRAGFRLRHRRAAQGCNGPLLRGDFRQLGLVGADGFRDLRADGQNRVQRGHGLLKNHGDLPAAHALPIALRQAH
jgi:hypothetical protein